MDMTLTIPYTVYSGRDWGVGHLQHVACPGVTLHGVIRHPRRFQSPYHVISMRWVDTMVIRSVNKQVISPWRFFHLR